MAHLYRAYSKHSGELFYESDSLEGIREQHAGIAGTEQPLLEAVDFAGRQDADYIVFKLDETADAMADFDIYGNEHGQQVGLPEGVTYIGHYKAVADVLDDLEVA